LLVGGANALLTCATPTWAEIMTFYFSIVAGQATCNNNELQQLQPATITNPYCFLTKTTQARKLNPWVIY